MSYSKNSVENGLTNAALRYKYSIKGKIIILLLNKRAPGKNIAEAQGQA